jgi:peptidyl-prolyl cis-trans isomerase SurA
MGRKGYFKQIIKCLGGRFRSAFTNFARFFTDQTDILSMTKHLFFAAVLLCSLVSGFSQTPDPVLFSVNGVAVPLSEFRYIYAKTNQDKADFSRASLEEYLDLYVKFKLKVQKARDLRVDTVPTLREELDGYRRQLAGSYLVDKEVTDKMIRETYERMMQDVDMSYIFVACDRNAPAADTLRAFQRCANWLKMIRGGASFEKVAADSSEDRSAKENFGALGFTTAMFPDGYYLLEKAVYAAKPGDVLGPIRSFGGYQIVRVNAFRPARGEAEIAQIMTRKGDSPSANAAAKTRIDSIYTALQKGAKWDELCSAVSDDKLTSARGGYLGFFGIARYQKSFEDAAFAIEKDGEYSKPVETTIGWHIIKRLSRRPVGSFDSQKRALTERVRRDSRSEVAKQSMIARIKREGQYKENTEAFNKWMALQIDTVFHTFRWKPDPALPQTPLIQFGTAKTYTLADFEEYCGRATRERMRGQGFPVNETIQKLFAGWTADCAMQFEETQLERKYPEFKALMREYEEGMMLFEVAKQEVWDKANTDTVGLEKYFNETLKSKYLWEERAKVSFYTVKTDDPKLLTKVRALIAKKTAADVLKKLNKPGKPELVAMLERTYEKGKNKDIDGLWQAGAMSAAKTDATTKTTSFTKTEAIIPPTPKALNEARGYAVADYQDYLEKKWVETLKQQYKIDVNKAAFETLIKK